MPLAASGKDLVHHDGEHRVAKRCGATSACTHLLYCGNGFLIESSKWTFEPSRLEGSSVKSTHTPGPSTAGTQASERATALVRRWSPASDLFGKY